MTHGSFSSIDWTTLDVHLWYPPQTSSHTVTSLNIHVTFSFEAHLCDYFIRNLLKITTDQAVWFTNQLFHLLKKSKQTSLFLCTFRHARSYVPLKGHIEILTHALHLSCVREGHTFSDQQAIRRGPLHKSQVHTEFPSNIFSVNKCQTLSMHINGIKHTQSIFTLKNQHSCIRQHSTFSQ